MHYLLPMRRLSKYGLASCATTLLPLLIGMLHGPAQAQDPAPPFESTLSSTFFMPPVTSSRLKDLSPETDRPRTQGLLAATTWLKGSFSTEAEVANNQGGTEWLQSKVPGDTRDDGRGRMMRLGLTGTTGQVKYGMTYRNAGHTFYNAPDLAVREAWGEWKHGFTALRTTMGQQWNNTAGDSSRSRMEQTYGRVGLMWNKPEWPNLALTYARTSLNSALDPLGITPQRSQQHTLEAALAYNRPTWNARLASSYILAADSLRNGAESNVTVQTFTALFRPLNTLTITPTVMYRSEHQDWSGARISSPSASLAFQYKQSQRLLVSAMGNYAGTRSSDGLVDQETVGGRGVLSWDLEDTHDWATLISLEAGYNRLSNRVTPSADTEDISGLVRIVLASL